MASNSSQSSLHAPKTDYFNMARYLIELSKYVPSLVIQQMIRKHA